MIKYHTYTMEMIETFGWNKKDLLKKMIIDSELSTIGIDFAVPQYWLNQFVKDTKISYNWMISTTFYAYPPKHSFGLPISGCTEIDEVIKKWCRKHNDPFDPIHYTLSNLHHDHNNQLHSYMGKVNRSLRTLVVAERYIKALENKLIANKLSMPELSIDEAPQDPLDMIIQTKEVLNK